MPCETRTPALPQARATLAACPRSVLVLMHALRSLPGVGATYAGLAYALGHASARSVARTAADASALGYTRVVHTGNGRGCKSFVALTPRGLQLMTDLQAHHRSNNG